MGSRREKAATEQSDSPTSWWERIRILCGSLRSQSDAGGWTGPRCPDMHLGRDGGAATYKEELKLLDFLKSVVAFNRNSQQEEKSVRETSI